MPSVDTADHRQSSPELLVAALRRHDALALAEACSRTVAAAHGIARRLLPRAEVEPLLRELYSALWADPPPEAELERWVRQRCFATAVARLRERGTAPASPSAHLLLGDLPGPAAAFLDGSEQALAGMDAEAVRTLVRAHDAGVPAGGGTAGLLATRALLALAESDADIPPGAAAGVDWVCGLLPPAGTAATAAALAEAGPDLQRALRRGRRRLEGLPPSGDLAPRLVAVALSETPPDLTVTLEGESGEALTVALAAAPNGDQRPAAAAPTTDGDERPAAAAPATDGDERPATAPPDARDGHQRGEDTARLDGPDLAQPGPPLDSPDGAPAAPRPEVADDAAARFFEADEPPGDEAPDRPARRRPRRLLLVVGWLLAVGAAIGTGMLIGRLLLEFGLL